MKRIVTIFICFCTITIFLWGRTRFQKPIDIGISGGAPEASGVAPDADPPIEWSENKNVRWKTAIPGQGHATPIVWDDTVFCNNSHQYLTNR